MVFRTPILCSAFALASFSALFAQNEPTPPKDWFLRDPETDHLQGVSAERTYSELLKGRPSRTIIVAVVDSGVDAEHEDLRSVMWTNEKEIPGNGIDDDKNGYVDDIHGWNFIGGKNGNVHEDTYELTREYMRLRKIFADADPATLPKNQKKEYEHYLKIKDDFEKLRNTNQRQFDVYRSYYLNFKAAVDTLKGVLKVDSLTVPLVDSVKMSRLSLAFAKGNIMSWLRRVEETNIEKALAELKEGYEYFKPIVEFGYNPEFDSRLIVGDNYENVNERFYGNNDVKGPDAEHGTHVAGIIAADRKNGLGIRGIADNVRIMSVRAVPNGDERDKDVANAIRYAVDNGAHIINMSFGKSFSPEKSAVDDAVRYAEKKGVILVHASGNEAKDNDKVKNFPSRYFLDGKEAKNWLEISASSAGNNEKFVADFSNYGKKSVDLFAPGVDIYSTTPDNSYKNESGTSMASPAATGVIAVLMEYFPNLTPTQILDIVRKSTRQFDGLKVQKPGGGKADFSDLSKTGGLINAYEAVKMAMTIQPKVER